MTSHESQEYSTRHSNVALVIARDSPQWYDTSTSRSLSRLLIHHPPTLLFPFPLKSCCFQLCYLRDESIILSLTHFYWAVHLDVLLTTLLPTWKSSSCMDTFIPKLWSCFAVPSPEAPAPITMTCECWKHSKQRLTRRQKKLLRLLTFSGVLFNHCKIGLRE